MVSVRGSDVVRARELGHDVVVSSVVMSRGVCSRILTLLKTETALARHGSLIICIQNILYSFKLSKYDIPGGKMSWVGRVHATAWRAEDSAQKDFMILL